LLMLQRFGKSLVVRQILCSLLVICFAQSASGQASQQDSCVAELPVSEDIVLG
jgi:hypothetical protein